MNIHDVSADHLRQIAESGSLTAMRNALVNVAKALAEERPAAYLIHADMPTFTVYKEVADQSGGFPVTPLYAIPPSPDARGSDDLANVASKALTRAWLLGQTYWQQADSESYSQNKKSYETRNKFDALVNETCTTIEKSMGAKP